MNGKESCIIINCNSVGREIYGASDSLLRKGSTSAVVDSIYESEFLIYFFNIYICLSDHVKLKCLKCSYVCTRQYGVQHISRCYYYPDIISNIVWLRGSKKCVGIHDLRKILPQSQYMQINYNDSAIVDLLTDDKNFGIYGDYNSIYSENPLMLEIVHIVVKQDVRCLLCGRYFDCFPTGVQLLKHFSNCQ